MSSNHSGWLILAPRDRSIISRCQSSGIARAVQAQPWQPNSNVRKFSRVGEYYAREISFFVNYVGFTPLQALTCATPTGAEILGRGHELGTLEPGKLADVLVVEGDVVADVSILEDRRRFLAVMQGGVVKAGQCSRA